MGAYTDGRAGDESDPAPRSLILKMHIVGEPGWLDRLDLIDQVSIGDPFSFDENGIADTDLTKTVEERTIPAHPVSEDDEVAGLPGFTRKRHTSGTVAKLDHARPFPKRDIAVDRRNAESAVGNQCVLCILGGGNVFRCGIARRGDFVG